MNSTAINQRTFNPKSENYYKDLKKAGYITDAQLKAAELKSAPEMEEADTQIAQYTIFISQRPLTQAQEDSVNNAGSATKKNNPSETITSEFLKKAEARDVQLKNTQQKLGYTFAKNKGTNNNCLIISLIQHITGKYDNEHTVKATLYRETLDNELKKTEGKNFKPHRELEIDHCNFLIAEMKKDQDFKDTEFFIKNKSISVWMADENGNPVSFSVGDNKDKVIIFQGARHFEAVIPPAETSTKEIKTSASSSVANNKTTKPGSDNADPLLIADNVGEMSFDQTDFPEDLDSMFKIKDK